MWSTFGARIESCPPISSIIPTPFSKTRFRLIKIKLIRHTEKIKIFPKHKCTMLNIIFDFLNHRLYKYNILFPSKRYNARPNNINLIKTFRFHTTRYLSEMVFQDKSELIFDLQSDECQTMRSGCWIKFPVIFEILFGRIVFRSKRMVG